MLIQRSSRLFLSIYLGAGISMASWGQDASTASAAPVAHVYVSSLPANSNTGVVNAYAASTTGRLTRVTGSPFKAINAGDNEYYKSTTSYNPGTGLGSLDVNALATTLGVN